MELELPVKIVDERNIVKKPKSKKNYVNGPDFHKAISDYYKLCDEAPKNNQPQVPRYLGECIIFIAKGLGSKINFASYSFNEELQNDAIEKMIEAIIHHKYDPSMNKNPVGYFSQISWNSFLQRIALEKKEMYKKHKNFENMFFNHGEDIEDLFSNDEHKRIIEEFEKPKERSVGYLPHKNLSYDKNRTKKIKSTEEGQIK